MNNSEWKECAIGDILTLEYGKPVIDKDCLDGDTPVYGTNGPIGTSNLEPLCKIPSIIIGRKGAYRGVHYSPKPFSVIDTGFYVMPKSNDFDMKWLYYKLQTFDINRMDSGSAIPSTDRYEIYSLPIKLPPLAIQKEIAKILYAFDDKIELNNAINRNLAEQAQAIFKNWFIDFEPFGGEIPKDWKNGKLSDIAEYEKEKIDIAKLNIETYYSTENMLSNKAGVSKATNLPAVEQTTRCFPGETIISNIRPYFKKIFYCTEEIAGCSTDVLCFKPKKESFSFYNYNLLYSNDFFDYMVKGSKGTKMPRGDKSQIMNYDVVVPTESVISDFNTVVSNILQQISNNKRENECLTKLRDTLLPNLMSGELCLNT